MTTQKIIALVVLCVCIFLGLLYLASITVGAMPIILLLLVGALAVAILL